LYSPNIFMMIKLRRMRWVGHAEKTKVEMHLLIRQENLKIRSHFVLNYDTSIEGRTGRQIRTEF
jgi:hypothetical protein